jgi:hypothetical protein
MSFKENLLKKIEIDKMSRNILATIGPPGSEYKVDKGTMRRLLEMGSYKFSQERDLDLYISELDSDREKILVLDNELAIYNTTVADVALRKSPTLKEMISIRNIIKILNDSDVVVSKRKESVATIQKECIERIDLSFEKSDIEEIVKDGVASLERGYAEGVIEALDLFAELLGYCPPPRVFDISQHKIIGALSQKENGEIIFGPIITYSIIHNLLKLIDEKIGSFDKEKIEYLQQVAVGRKEASAEGPGVFQYLKKGVVN